MFGLLAGLVLLLPSRGLAADGFWLLNGRLGLTGQSNWNYYNGGDAPEGSYMGWLYSGTTNLTGSVPLGRTLAPGNYYIFLKVIDYMEGGAINVSLGQTSTTLRPDNGDWNKYWTGPALVPLERGSSNLTINLLKTIASTSTQKYLIRGVYVTTNAHENVPLYGYDRVVDYTYPTSMYETPDRKGNVIPDGSFETGINHGWGLLVEGYERPYALSALWETNAAYDGLASVRFLSKASRLISRTLTLTPNKKYTLSAFARRGSATYAEITLGIYNVGTPPPNFPAVCSLAKTFVLSSSWTRYSLSGYMTNYPDANFQVFVVGNTNVYLDAIQLEEGDLSPFKPALDVEIGFLRDKPGRMLYEDQNPALNVVASNSSTQTSLVTLVYEVYDIYNRKVTAGEKQLSVAASSRLVDPLVLPVKRGIFRVVAWLKDRPRTLEEVTYAVIPQPRVLGLDQLSMIGVHPNLMPYQLALHQRMGIKWGRALSPESIFRWSLVEKVEGQITWFDDKVNNAAPYGMTIMGTIGNNFEWPTWANTNGLPNLDKWESFVDRLVTHYKDRVKYWEIWNESIYDFTPQFYTELLKRAAIAIRRADPSAKIVGMGGVYDKNWVIQIMNLLGANWKQSLDIISTHLYPSGTDPSGGEAEGRAVAFKREVIDRYGVEVWNTETGVWDEGFYKGVNSSFGEPGEPMSPASDSSSYVSGCYYEAERLMDNFVHCVGNGLTKYFYYDSRIYATPGYQRSHPTMLDYDDSIRAKGIVYSIAANFLDGSRGLGGLYTNTTTYAYLFDRGGKGTVVVWSKDKLNHSLRLTAADWRAFDMVGNEMAFTNSTILFGRTPVYIQSASLSLAAMRSAFQAGVISSRADTLPPSLSIDEFPTGPTAAKKIPLSWLGIDETSVPSGNDQDAVTYSYLLEGRDANWSDWTPATRLTLVSLPVGSYTFRVRARDAAGNISAIVSRSFTVSSPVALGSAKNLRKL